MEKEFVLVTQTNNREQNEDLATAAVSSDDDGRGNTDNTDNTDPIERHEETCSNVTLLKTRRETVKSPSVYKTMCYGTAATNMPSRLRNCTRNSESIDDDTQKTAIKISPTKKKSFVEIFSPNSKSSNRTNTKMKDPPFPANQKDLFVGVTSPAKKNKMKNTNFLGNMTAIENAAETKVHPDVSINTTKITNQTTDTVSSSSGLKDISHVSVVQPLESNRSTRTFNSAVNGMELDDIESPFILPTRSSRTTIPKSSICTRVSGIGMWNNWLRSFDSPMQAILDLFDNAVDASWTLLNDKNLNGVKRRTIKPQIHIHQDIQGAQKGIVLRNACKNSLPPLKEIMTVYKSSKSKKVIGENGVGLKHACAHLSDLSFVFTKTNGKYGIGILMKDLQLDEGIVLPSIELAEHTDLKKSLTGILTKFPKTWGKAFESYGVINGGTAKDGISFCISHLQAMSTGVWAGQSHVFTMVLTDLRHIDPKDLVVETVICEQEEDRLFGVENLEGGHIEDASRFLNKLKERLPKEYLHLHHLDVFVQYELVDSLYWEKRLVEVTCFTIPISAEISWKNGGDKMNGVFIHSEGVNNNIDNQSMESNKMVRFFIGFDPFRVKQSSMLRSSATLSVWSYSRESGRRIKTQHDPRRIYGLASTSSDYSQGLTVIVDDFNGTMPLNPTKQDFAFGYANTGQVHKENVEQWTAAVAHCCWNMALEDYSINKGALAQGVQESVKNLREKNENDESLTRPFEEEKHITYRNIQFRNHNGQLRTLKRDRGKAVFSSGSGDQVPRINEVAATTAQLKADLGKKVKIEQVKSSAVNKERVTKKPRKPRATKNTENIKSGKKVSPKTKKKAPVAASLAPLRKKRKVATDCSRTIPTNTSKELSKKLKQLEADIDNLQQEKLDLEVYCKQRTTEVDALRRENEDLLKASKKLHRRNDKLYAFNKEMMKYHEKLLEDHPEIDDENNDSIFNPGFSD